MSKSNVTLRDIYDIVDRLENKVDERLEKIEQRTSVLERFQEKVMVYGALSVALVGFAGALFKDLVVEWIRGR